MNVYQYLVHLLSYEIGEIERLRISSNESLDSDRSRESFAMLLKILNILRNKFA